MPDELTKNARLQKIFNTLEAQGMDGKQVLKDLLTIKPEELLSNRNAMDLLKEWLEPEELKEFIEKGELTIKSKLHENREYKISRGRYDLTHVIEDGKHTQDLCVHAINNEELPYGDSILTKIIALKTDETHFLANSNVRQLIAQEYRPAPERHQVTTRAMLQQRHNEVRIERLGLVSTPPMPPSITPAFLQANIRYGIAQALIDNISYTEEGLVVRGWLPREDLRTTDYYVQNFGSLGENSECPPYWRQPVEGTYKESGKEFEVYQTNINCNNDRKVYMLFGFMNLMPSEKNYVSYIKIYRHHVRIIDIIDTSNINLVECIKFNTPMLFKCNDDMAIRFGLNDEAKGKFSRLMPLGCVVESIGNVVAG